MSLLGALGARGRAVAAVVGVLLALAGCTETPSVTPLPAGSGPQPVPAGQSGASNPDQTATKRAAGIAACPATDASPAKGGLPDVRLACLGGGREVRLAELRGPTLVNVWASWCGPCRSEAPVLAEAGRTGSAVSLIGIDHADDPAAAVPFAAQAGWTYPQLYDADLALRAPLQVLGLPVTFFVRPDGTLAGRHAGPFTSRQQLDDLSRQYLGVAP